MISAEHRAQVLRERLRLTLPAVDVCDIAQALGIAVNYVVLEGLSVTTFCHDTEIEAFVDDTQPDYRQRLALAHAIGHSQLHPGRAFACTLVAPEVTAPIRRVEREASRFAAALLMPDWAVRWLYAKGYSDEELAEVFRVSTEAVFWRLHHLGLIREQRYRATAD
jgi:Zn-dependent peptidase ImmA (M78 family)